MMWRDGRRVTRMSADAPTLDDLIAELRAKLKRLHRLKGEPSTRELARRTGGVITHTTVHGVLRCSRLPRWGPLELVVEALGGDQEEFRQLWVAIRDATDVVSATTASVADGFSAEAGKGHPSDQGSEGTNSHDSLELKERVLTVVATTTRIPSDKLELDSDGDVGIRAGSAMVFVRVRDNPPLIDVFSPILKDVDPSEALYVKLSELTNRLPIGRIYCADDTVWASIPVFGRNFQPMHLMLAIQVMTALADELDDRLRREFGGRRFFDPPTNL